MLDNNRSKRTQGLYGKQSVMDVVTQFLSRRDRIDLCGDFKAPARVLGIYKKLTFEPKSEIGTKLNFLQILIKKTFHIARH